MHSTAGHLRVDPRREGGGRSFLLRYGCAAVSIALATGVRMLLDPVLGGQIPFATVLLAVLVTAWYGGLRPALVAVFLGFFSVYSSTFVPHGGLALYVSLILYLGVAGGIAVVGGVMHTAPIETIQTLRTAQASLAQSEERLRIALHSSGMAVCTWNIQPDFVEADESFSSLFGLAFDRMPKTVAGITALMHPGDREYVQQHLADAVERGAEYNTEFRVLWPDGSIRFLATRGKVSTAADGRPERLTGVTWDVTECRQAEKNLRTTTKKLAAEGEVPRSARSCAGLRGGGESGGSDRFGECAGRADVWLPARRTDREHH